MALGARHHPQHLTGPVDVCAPPATSPRSHGTDDSDEHCFRDEAATVNYSHTRIRIWKALGGYLKQQYLRN